MLSAIEIAIVCHEANRAYCQQMGDYSHMQWDSAPQWQHNSAVKGVVFILENPSASPSSSHDSWLSEKKADGWKYGPVKDAEKKEHPCYVPYEDLPIEQKRKDYLFGAIVRSLIQE